MNKYLSILALGLLFGCQQKDEEDPSEIDQIVIHEEAPWNTDQRNYEVSVEEQQPHPQEILTTEIE